MSNHIMHVIKKEIMSDSLRQRSLSYEDLSDKKGHAINQLLEGLVHNLKEYDTKPEVRVERRSPITTVEYNFDRLRFPLDNPGRSSTYTRYISENEILRTHTTAMIPEILDELEPSSVEDLLLVLPGLVYRRDVSDKTHSGEFHQLDIWRVTKGRKYTRQDLINLVDVIFESLMPGYKPIIYEAKHPYTLDGIEVYAEMDNGEMLEILEAGIAHPEVLKASGFDPELFSGLAYGPGLERILMIRKQIPDVRLIRSQDERVQRQMHDLNPYIPVSFMPPVQRDMSYSVPKTHQEEDISEDIRNALGEEIEILESVEIVEETDYESLHPKAIEKLGISKDQKNVLVRVVLRSLEKSLTKEYANNLIDAIYEKINYGSKGYSQ